MLMQRPSAIGINAGIEVEVAWEWSATALMAAVATGDQPSTVDRCHADLRHARSHRHIDSPNLVDRLITPA
jgi:hypothetical protein